MDELLARLRALLRRESQDKTTKISFCENLAIDLAAKKITNNNEPIDLSPLEYRIIEYLIVNRGKAMSSHEIYEAVWGNDAEDALFSNSLKVHIARLRKKLGQNCVKTIPSCGYMIE